MFPFLSSSAREGRTCVAKEHLVHCRQAAADGFPLAHVPQLHSQALCLGGLDTLKLSEGSANPCSLAVPLTTN